MLLFISIGNTCIIKFAIYLCSKFFFLGLSFVSVIRISEGLVYFFVKRFGKEFILFLALYIVWMLECCGRYGYIFCLHLQC
jgi:hypothetical protein